MRIRDPKTTALIFASGKMVVTGAKSEDQSKLASRKYARIIQKLGFNAKFTDFKIQNIVGSCDVKFPIRLEGLASKHHNFSSYEPELFPGLIYRMMKPKIVLLIFVSGKIVLTGAKVREEIYQAFELIYPVLSGNFARRLLVMCVNRVQISESLKDGSSAAHFAARPSGLCCINTSLSWQRRYEGRSDGRISSAVKSSVALRIHPPPCPSCIARSFIELLYLLFFRV